jgi:hypothetical protein
VENADRSRKGSLVNPDFASRQSGGKHGRLNGRGEDSAAIDRGRGHRAPIVPCRTMTAGRNPQVRQRNVNERISACCGLTSTVVTPDNLAFSATRDLLFGVVSAAVRRIHVCPARTLPP